MGIIQGIIIRAKVLAGTLRTFSPRAAYRLARNKDHFTKRRVGFRRSIRHHWLGDMWCERLRRKLPDGWRFWGRNPVKGGA